MKLKCHRFIVLTFVVQQLLLLDDLTLEAFFSLYTTTQLPYRSTRISSYCTNGDLVTTISSCLLIKMLTGIATYGTAQRQLDSRG